MLERHVEKRSPRFGEHVVALAEIAVDMDAPPAALGHPRGHRELAVDEHRSAVADEDPRGHDGEAVPGAEEAARLVQGCSDEPAVRDTRRRLVALAEGEGRLVAFDALLRGEREVNAVRVLSTPPARRIVMGRDLYRRPPRSKWAL